MLKAYLMLMAAAALAGCGVHYDEEIERNFMKSCQARGTSSERYCSCALGIVKQRYSQAEYMEIDRKVAAGEPAPADFMKVVMVAAQECK